MTFPTSGALAEPALAHSQSRSEAIEIAEGIARTLARDAMWHGDRCNWLGPTSDLFMGRLMPAYGMLGPSLYNGTAGVGLFLAQLAAITQEPVAQATARAAVRHALSRCDDVPAQVRFGFQTGHVGIAYAALVAGDLLCDGELHSGGRALLADVLQRPVGDACILDAMVGFAGAIPAVLAARNVLDVDLDIAPLKYWADTLVAAAEQDQRGLSWDTTSEMRRSLDASAPAWMASAQQRRPNLLGLAHGAGGIALALLELANETGDSRLSETAERAFAYEDSWFDSVSMCWPDLRHHQDTDAHQTHVAWCHGAVGIGLVRIRAWELTGNPRHREWAITAMRATAAALDQQLRPEVNFCLCHGIAGNAELFLHDSVGFGMAGHRHLEAVLRLGMDVYHRPGRPWCYGESSEARVPLGLMTGLAGTGHFFLRMAAPDAVPSILLTRTDRRGTPPGFDRAMKGQHKAVASERSAVSA